MLGGDTVTRVAGGVPQSEEQAHGAGRDVVVEHRARVGGPAEPPRRRVALGRQLGEPAAVRELRRDEEVARAPGRREVRLAAGASPALEQRQPRGRSARAPHDDQVPRREAERRERVLRRPHHQRERLGPRSRRARERPPAGGPLRRDERVERVRGRDRRDAQEDSDAESEGERDDETRAVR